MAYLLLTLIILSMVVFIYESVLLPSIRLRMRFELFALRDRLRLLKIEKPDELDDTTFKYGQESLNMLLGFLHRYDIASFVKAAFYLKQNPSLFKRIQKRREIIENCPSKEFQEIHTQSVKIGIVTATANSFFLFVLLFILVLPILLLIKGLTYIKSQVKDNAAELFSIPERESDVLNRICTG